MRIVVGGFPHTTPMKRIKLEGLNDPYQNIRLLILCETPLTKKPLEREKESISLFKRSSLHLLYLLDGGYMIDASN